MKKSKICFIVSDVNKSHQLEALFNGVRDTGYEVSLVFISDSLPELFLTFRKSGFLVKFIECHGKTDMLRAALQLYRILAEIKPDIVHTHLFKAAFLGLPIAKLQKIKKRVQTRHHADEAHLYYPHAVRYDRFSNWLSSTIVAVSNNVSKILVEIEGVRPDKIKVVHHGFNLEDFVAEPSKILALKEKYQLNGCYPVIGAVSRFTHWKGVQHIIPAFKALLKKYPKAILVLANATGDYKDEILDLLKEIDESRYIMIEFESNILALFKTFDVFIHVPVNERSEAFGQIYVEALAMGIPSVFTLSGVASDFIKDKENALVVSHCNSQEITEAVARILEDSSLSEKIIVQGRRDVKKFFHIDEMIKSLDSIYSDV
ncbi:MAG: glycosyltransferase family 4 protein [Pyrinomonadaceae bacterium]|nr:glycosyltransferase family 4 protein [Pyrinomonadaceae bacterium]